MLISPPSHYQVLLILISAVKACSWQQQQQQQQSCKLSPAQVLRWCLHCSKVNKLRFGKFKQVSDLRFDIILWTMQSASHKPTFFFLFFLQLKPSTVRLKEDYITDTQRSEDHPLQISSFPHLFSLIYTLHFCIYLYKSTQNTKSKAKWIWYHYFFSF